MFELEQELNNTTKMVKVKLKYIVSFLIINVAFKAHSQYLPKDGAKLNYNQIYFEYPYIEDAVNYKLYLAEDTTENKSDFKNLINVYTDATPALRVNNLSFGKNYKWYIETTTKLEGTQKSEIHYFSILNSIYNDTSLYKRRINYTSKNTTNGIIWCDFSHCAFDRKGNIVWFMPTENSEYKETSRVRDIRFQKDGTLTFIKNPDALHTSLDIQTIWKAPLTGENSEKYKTGYHHSFEKLNNGNYMVLAYDFVELEKIDKTDTLVNKVELVNLIEFNHKHEIVWIWEMREQFPLDILAIPKENGRGIINAHCNAFSIDKENKYIYIGFRDISRIIKIEKSTKKIVASFGKKLNESDSLVTQTDLFSFPHDAKILSNNQIMVLNNNDFFAEKISSIEVFEQTKNKQANIKPVWDFKFNFDTLNSGKSLKLGNVKLLDNGNYLINEGSSNRIVEITKNKKILWDMMLYRYDLEKKKWTNAGPYRIDYSSSLYPYYYTLSTAKNSQKKTTFTIFNEGDYEDSYICELFDESGKIKLATIKTPTIKSQNKQNIHFNFETSNKNLIKIKSIESGISKELHCK